MRCLMPPGFAAEADLPNIVLMARYGVSKTALTRWRRKVGKPRHGAALKQAQPIPDGFAQAAVTRPNGTLAGLYGVSPTTAARWRAELGIAAWRAPKAAKAEKAANPPRELLPIPDDLAERAAELTRAALSRHYGRHHRTIDRWLRARGLKARRPIPRTRVPRPPRPDGAPPPAGPGRFVLPGKPPSEVPPPKSGPDEDAAQFLRRFYPMVCHCDRNGRADQRGLYWRCGFLVLKPKELIARALAKGFVPKTQT